MKELVEYLAKSLVDDPTQVEVRELGGTQEIRVELSVAPSDTGRVIGKSGRVVNAMRVLVRVAAAKRGKRATLDVR